MAIRKINENEVVKYVSNHTLKNNTLHVGELFDWMVERFQINRQYASQFIKTLCQNNRFYKARLVKKGRYVEVVK